MSIQKSTNFLTEYVLEPIMNQPFFNGLYYPFMVNLGMVYCFTHMNILPHASINSNKTAEACSWPGRWIGPSATHRCFNEQFLLWYIDSPLMDDVLMIYLFKKMMTFHFANCNTLPEASFSNGNLWLQAYEFHVFIYLTYFITMK